MTQFESSVKTIPFGQESVYAKLANLNNLESIKDKIPMDKVQDLNFTEDTLSFSFPPIGKVELSVLERDPYGCIKFGATTSPLPFSLWIELLAVTETECEMKLIIKAEINPFIKGLIQKPLQDGLEKMSDMLAAIPY